MRAFIVALCCLILAACGTSGDSQDVDSGSTVITSGGGKLTLGVNSYLWQASLSTLSFMPLASEDPFGGVIITDWYVNPQAPGERMKVTVYVISRQLRADGIRLAVFRQTRNSDGSWSEAQVNPDVATKLEDEILTRARELRLASVGVGG
ncbi:MAG: DUF3576 domain-containing protein [Alphaproteobacteria bacterium]|nr:DUF3576 domain-containing protein [Alphaproteobacteria bacterium]MBU6473501.1 DUF3576 domain-containing protein [Alphaproteobacteria bacterium]MDE2012897.1 DUF3576 domain-containing protein [Alphaproteobacteria bacterium]MDE2074845.1 DUF3576 domain-containing protein [Alphaproteobacteria bacterium]